jgi:hypothetical protein
LSKRKLLKSKNKNNKIKKINDQQRDDRSSHSSKRDALFDKYQTKAVKRKFAKSSNVNRKSEV